MSYTSYRHHSFSLRASSSSLSDNEDDAITPVEEHEDGHTEPQQMKVSLMQKPAAAYRAIDSPFENARLWRRMLALQRRFHCYNSARMSAALEDAEVEAAVPPRACMDLLNDSIATAWLCEEARAEVAVLLTLVPDGIRSRTGSYGDIYGGAGASQTAVVTQNSSSLPLATTTNANATTLTPGKQSSRRQLRMLRRRRLNHRQAE